MQRTNPTKNGGMPLPTTREMRRDIVLSCRDVSHGFGDKQVLCDINLDVGRGQIVGIVGPSGCGKSTLLRAIVGTHPARGGSIVMSNAPNGRLIAQRMHRGGTMDTIVRGPGRDRGIVYQRYTLSPNLTAVQNVAKGLEWDRTTLLDRIVRPFRQHRLRKEWLRDAEELLVKVGLKEALRMYPHELSGGMCQRVAIAQALIMKPEVLLMDEPFGALDEATREDLQRMMLELYGENLAAVKEGRKPPYTVIIVTHGLNEALYVGDRVVGLSQYWDWHAGLPHGNERKHFDNHPGATIVYDAPAPVHDADGIRNFEEFNEQRELIRRCVFEPDTHRVPGEHITFWNHVGSGTAQGVMA